MPAALFVRSDSPYFDLGADCWTIDRDARLYRGDAPVVAHPPCRAWGRLRAFAKPRPDEKDLALFAVDTVRRCGGVLEHPEASSLWPAAGLPRPGDDADKFGGWTFPVSQKWWGHRAEKRTWLYIVGVSPRDIPAYPLVLGDAPMTISTSRRVDTAGGRYRRGVPLRERELTPPEFAKWLIDLAEVVGVRHHGPITSDAKSQIETNRGQF